MPTDRYAKKSPYSMTPKFIIIHNTGNNATARNEIAFMIRSDWSTSFHYSVDENEVVQGLPLNRNSWQAGDGRNGNGNRNGISIEIARSTSPLVTFKKAEENGAWLTAQLLKQFGWKIDKVTKHQDYSGKYCPHTTLNLGWERFLDMVKGFMVEKVTVPTENAYVVKSGDTLIEIAEKLMGDGDKYEELAKYNNISNPNVISIGQVIKLPPKLPLKPVVVAPVPSVHYLVKITVSALARRKTPQVASGNFLDYIRDRGIYTIVEEKNGWGKLITEGAGWIYLAYTRKL